ncbi:MAG TPA: 30S ribosomal protein S16 [Euzebyales bacterium]
MAVKMRLRREGKRKQPFYRVVVADARSPRDGRFIEDIGYYHPLREPSEIEIKRERALYWLGEGVQPSDAVRQLLRVTGIWDEFRPGDQGRQRESAKAAAAAAAEKAAASGSAADATATDEDAAAADATTAGATDDDAATAGATVDAETEDAGAPDGAEDAGATDDAETEDAGAPDPDEAEDADEAAAS